MGRKKGKGRCVRRNKQPAGVEHEESPELKQAPHSFVIHRGVVGSCLKDLVRDFRKVMEPFTASSLRVSKKNKVKDFLAVAGFLHVTHFLMFTRTEHGIYLRMARVPRGPTLSFRVLNYTLAKDVLSSLKKQCVFQKQFESSPLIVLNGFSGTGMHLKLMASMFQNMFPSINLLKVDLSSVRRCVLLNYDATTKLIDFRHYAIKVVPTGLSKGVKKLVVNKLPDLSQYNDMAEFIQNPTLLSESEAEDDKSNQVILPQKLSSRGNIASGISAIRLIEIGPRLTLQLLKAENGFLSGEVLYHDYVTKSAEEVKMQREKIKEKKMLKEKRRRIQEENVRRKEIMKSMKDETASDIQKRHSKDSKVVKGEDSEEKEEEDNDIEWYKEEVGEEPESGLFDETPTNGLKRKKSPLRNVKKKKLKVGKSSSIMGHSKDKIFKKKKLKMGRAK